MRYFLTVYRNPDDSLQIGYLLANKTIPEVEEYNFSSDSDATITSIHLLKMFPFMENVPEGDLVELSIKPISQICKTITYTEKPFKGEI